MSAQLALDLSTWPDQPRRSASAVQVNECSVNAVARVGEWWAHWRYLGHEEPRICIEGMSVAGDRLHVHCEDQDHAEWLHGFLLDKGVHASALKVLRRLTCEAQP